MFHRASRRAASATISSPATCVGSTTSAGVVSSSFQYPSQLALTRLHNTSALIANHHSQQLRPYSSASSSNYPPNRQHRSGSSGHSSPAGRREVIRTGSGGGGGSSNNRSHSHSSHAQHHQSSNSGKKPTRSSSADRSSFAHSGKTGEVAAPSSSPSSSDWAAELMSTSLRQEEKASATSTPSHHIRSGNSNDVVGNRERGELKGRGSEAVSSTSRSPKGSDTKRADRRDSRRRGHSSGSSGARHKLSSGNRERGKETSRRGDSPSSGLSLLHGGASNTRDPSRKHDSNSRRNRHDQQRIEVSKTSPSASSIPSNDLSSPHGGQQQQQGAPATAVPDLVYLSRAWRYSVLAYVTGEDPLQVKMLSENLNGHERKVKLMPSKATIVKEIRLLRSAIDAHYRAVRQQQRGTKETESGATTNSVDSAASASASPSSAADGEVDGAILLGEKDLMRKEGQLVLSSLRALVVFGEDMSLVNIKHSLRWLKNNHALLSAEDTSMVYHDLLSLSPRVLTSSRASEAQKEIIKPSQKEEDLSLVRKSEEEVGEVDSAPSDGESGNADYDWLDQDKAIFNSVFDKILIQFEDLDQVHPLSRLALAYRLLGLGSQDSAAVLTPSKRFLNLLTHDYRHGRYLFEVDRETDPQRALAILFMAANVAFSPNYSYIGDADGGRCIRQIQDSIERRFTAPHRGAPQRKAEKEVNNTNRDNNNKNSEKSESGEAATKSEKDSTALSATTVGSGEVKEEIDMYEADGVQVLLDDHELSTAIRIMSLTKNVTFSSLRKILLSRRCLERLINTAALPDDGDVAAVASAENAQQALPSLPFPESKVLYNATPLEARSAIEGLLISRTLHENERQLVEKVIVENITCIPDLNSRLAAIRFDLSVKRKEMRERLVDDLLMCCGEKVTSDVAADGASYSWYKGPESFDPRACLTIIITLKDSPRIPLLVALFAENALQDVHRVHLTEHAAFVSLLVNVCLDNAATAQTLIYWEEENLKSKSNSSVSPVSSSPSPTAVSETTITASGQVSPDGAKAEKEKPPTTKVASSDDNEMEESSVWHADGDVDPVSRTDEIPASAAMRSGFDSRVMRRVLPRAVASLSDRLRTAEPSALRLAEMVQCLIPLVHLYETLPLEVAHATPEKSALSDTIKKRVSSLNPREAGIEALTSLNVHVEQTHAAALPSASSSSIDTKLIQSTQSSNTVDSVAVEGEEHTLLEPKLIVFDQDEVDVMRNTAVRVTNDIVAELVARMAKPCQTVAWASIALRVPLRPQVRDDFVSYLASTMARGSLAPLILREIIRAMFAPQQESQQVGKSENSSSRAATKAKGHSLPANGPALRNNVVFVARLMGTLSRIVQNGSVSESTLDLFSSFENPATTLKNLSQLVRHYTVNTSVENHFEADTLGKFSRLFFETMQVIEALRESASRSEPQYLILRSDASLSAPHTSSFAARPSPSNLLEERILMRKECQEILQLASTKRFFAISFQADPAVPIISAHQVEEALSVALQARCQIPRAAVSFVLRTVVPLIAYDTEQAATLKASTAQEHLPPKIDSVFSTNTKAVTSEQNPTQNGTDVVTPKTHDLGLTGPALVEHILTSFPNTVQKRLTSHFIAALKLSLITYIDLSPRNVDIILSVTVPSGLPLLLLAFETARADTTRILKKVSESPPSVRSLVLRVWAAAPARAVEQQKFDAAASHLSLSTASGSGHGREALYASDVVDPVIVEQLRVVAEGVSQEGAIQILRSHQTVAALPSEVVRALWKKTENVFISEWSRGQVAMQQENRLVNAEAGGKRKEASSDEEGVITPSTRESSSEFILNPETLLMIAVKVPELAQGITTTLQARSVSFVSLLSSLSHRVPIEFVDVALDQLQITSPQQHNTKAVDIGNGGDKENEDKTTNEGSNRGTEKVLLKEPPSFADTKAPRVGYSKEVMATFSNAVRFTNYMLKTFFAPSVKKANEKNKGGNQIKNGGPKGPNSSSTVSEQTFIAIGDQVYDRLKTLLLGAADVKVYCAEKKQEYIEAMAALAASENYPAAESAAATVAVEGNKKTASSSETSSHSQRPTPPPTVTPQDVDKFLAACGTVHVIMHQRANIAKAEIRNCQEIIRQEKVKLRLFTSASPTSVASSGARLNGDAELILETRAAQQQEGADPQEIREEPDASDANPRPPTLTPKQQKEAASLAEISAKQALIEEALWDLREIEDVVNTLRTILPKLVRLRTDTPARLEKTLASIPAPLRPLAIEAFVGDAVLKKFTYSDPLDGIVNQQGAVTVHEAVGDEIQAESNGPATDESGNATESQTETVTTDPTNTLDADEDITDGASNTQQLGEKGDTSKTNCQKSIKFATLYSYIQVLEKHGVYYLPFQEAIVEYVSRGLDTAEVVEGLRKTDGTLPPAVAAAVRDIGLARGSDRKVEATPSSSSTTVTSSSSSSPVEGGDDEPVGDRYSSPSGDEMSVGSTSASSSSLSYDGTDKTSTSDDFGEKPPASIIVASSGTPLDNAITILKHSLKGGTADDATIEALTTKLVAYVPADVSRVEHLMRLLQCYAESLMSFSQHQIVVQALLNVEAAESEISATDFSRVVAIMSRMKSLHHHRSSINHLLESIFTEADSHSQTVILKALAHDEFIVTENISMMLDCASQNVDYYTGDDVENAAAALVQLSNFVEFSEIESYVEQLCSRTLSLMTAVKKSTLVRVLHMLTHFKLQDVVVVNTIYESLEAKMPRLDVNQLLTILRSMVELEMPPREVLILIVLRRIESLVESMTPQQVCGTLALLVDLNVAFLTATNALFLRANDLKEQIRQHKPLQQMMERASEEYIIEAPPYVTRHFLKKQKERLRLQALLEIHLERKAAAAAISVSSAVHSASLAQSETSEADELVDDEDLVDRNDDLCAENGSSVVEEQA